MNLIFSDFLQQLVHSIAAVNHKKSLFTLAIDLMKISPRRR